MALEDDVKQAFMDAGDQLKKDLWLPADGPLLLARAQDLVAFNSKAAAATDPAIKSQYQAAARGVVDHVKLLALVRMQTLQADVMDALGRFFLNVLLPALAKLLVALF
jgi:hypothetical protein